MPLLSHSCYSALSICNVQVNTFSEPLLHIKSLKPSRDGFFFLADFTFNIFSGSFWEMGSLCVKGQQWGSLLQLYCSFCISTISSQGQWKEVIKYGGIFLVTKYILLPNIKYSSFSIFICLFLPFSYHFLKVWWVEYVVGFIWSLIQEK